MKENMVINEKGFVIDQEILAHLWLQKFLEKRQFPEDIGAMAPEDFFAAAHAGTLPTAYQNMLDVDKLLQDKHLVKLTDFHGNVGKRHAEKSVVAWLRPSQDQTAMQEFQMILGNLSLPDDFDWAGHVVEIHGSICA